MKPKNLHLASSMAELNKLSKTKGLLHDIPITRLISSANKVYQKAKLVDAEKDEEEAYKLFSTYYSIEQEITGRADYLKDKMYYNQLIDIKKSIEVIARMENLSQSLEKRYSMLSAARQAEADEKKKLQQKEMAAMAEEQQLKEKTSKPLTNGVENSSHADPEGMMSIKSLHTLITQQSTSFLVLDVRPADHYATSHAKLSQSINIPQHLLRKGLTAGEVSDHLDPDARMQWNRRGKVDCLILMDWGCEGPPFPAPLVALLDAILKWDPSTNDRCRSPVVLQGGYELFMFSYPMHVTNPSVEPPQLSGIRANGSSTTPFPTLDFQYPDLDTAFIESPPTKPPMDTAAAEPAAAEVHSLSVPDALQRPPASPLVTPRPLDAVFHPMFPTSPAHKKFSDFIFNRSLKPLNTPGSTSVPNGVLPQHQQAGSIINGLGGPRASPEPGGAPTIVGPQSSEAKGAGPRHLSSKGPVNPNGNTKSIHDLGKDKGKGEAAVPRVASRALKPFDLLNSLAGDSVIEEKRLLEEKVLNDEMALAKLSELERPGNSAADTQQLRQDLQTLQASSARMEEALAHISRENKDLWHCISSFVSSNNSSNNNNNSVDLNASGLPNGTLPHVPAASPPQETLPPLIKVPHIEGVSDRPSTDLDEQMMKEVLEKKKEGHEEFMAKVDKLRRLRKEKERQMRLQPTPASGARTGGTAKTYHAPLQDSPRHSSDPDDSRSTSNLRRSHSAFDLSQMGESLTPSPQHVPEAPPASGGSAFRRGMASIVPSIDRSLKLFQALSFRPRNLNAARKRDFGPICRVSDDLLDLMQEEGIYVEGFEEIDPIEKETSIVAQDQFPAPSSSYSGARKKKRGHDETAQELLKLAVEKLSSIDCEEEKLDDIDYFVRGIAQDMRKMDLTNKGVAKKLISEVVLYGTLGSLKPSSYLNTN